MRKKEGKILCRVMEWVNIFFLSISLFNVLCFLNVDILKNIFLSPDTSQGKVLILVPLLFPAAGKPSLAPLSAQNANIKPGSPGFKMDQLYLYPFTAVSREAAVLRCLIIPHLRGYSIAP